MNADQAVDEFASFALPQLREQDEPLLITQIDGLYNQFRKKNNIEDKQDISNVLFAFIDKYLYKQVASLDGRNDTSTVYVVKR